MRTLFIAPLLLTLACSPKEAAPHPAPAAEAPKPSTPASAPEAPQLQSRAGGLRWTATPPLVQRAPKSSMRAAEYGLENEPRAELSVFYFGADQGGSVDANIQRWLGQFSQPDGSDSAAKAKREELKIQGMAVTLVEVTGTYSGGMAAPGAAPSALTDARLLGAIASGPKGPIFFKLVGPAAALDGARPSFRALLESLTIDPG